MGFSTQSLNKTVIFFSEKSHRNIGYTSIMKILPFKSALTILLAIITLGFLVMSVTSYTHYSTIGIDNEKVQGEQVIYRYYRLWWPSNGALLIGYGETVKAFNPNQQYDLFDPAGTIFQNPHKLPEIKSSWNRLRFWWINNAEPKQLWIGMPAFLPVLLLGVLWWWLKRK